MMNNNLRHYEIVLLVHPDRDEQVGPMLAQYFSTISESAGTVHRKENWGRTKLAYPIMNLHLVIYVLLNIECTVECMEKTQRNV